MIIGCPGSGKTTFSRRLAEVLGRQAVHLDRLLWRPDWEMIPYDERLVIHNGLINADSWIIDGMWRSHVTDRMKRATAVLFLDYKRSVCLRRAVARRIRFAGKQRNDIAEGCTEKLDGDFIRYIWKFNKEIRPMIYELINRYSENIDYAVFKNPKEAEKFLSDLPLCLQTSSGDLQNIR